MNEKTLLDKIIQILIVVILYYFLRKKGITKDSIPVGGIKKLIN